VKWLLTTPLNGWNCFFRFHFFQMSYLSQIQIGWHILHCSRFLYSYFVTKNWSVNPGVKYVNMCIYIWSKGLINLISLLIYIYKSVYQKCYFYISTQLQLIHIWFLSFDTDFEINKFVYQLKNVIYENHNTVKLKNMFELEKSVWQVCEIFHTPP
jgi:hypothetical protein